MCVHVEARGGHQLFHSITLHLTEMGGLSLNPKLDKQSAVPGDLPISTPHGSVVMNMCVAMHIFYMGAEDLNSGLLSCTPSALTH